MRYSLPNPAPADAETYKSLRYVLTEHGPRYFAKAWRGKQQKPFANYQFRTAEARATWLSAQKQFEDDREQRRATRKLERAENLRKTIEGVQIGTILHYSWGYEQTQCEYFQVVYKSGRRVTLREIGSRVVPGSEGFMCDARQPLRDEFIGEPFAKMLNECGVTMDHGIASPCDEDAKHHCGWYA